MPRAGLTPDSGEKSLLGRGGLADDGAAVVAEHQHREPLDRLPLGRVHRRGAEPAAGAATTAAVGAALEAAACFFCL